MKVCVINNYARTVLGKLGCILATHRVLSSDLGHEDRGHTMQGLWPMGRSLDFILVPVPAAQS